MDDEKLIRPALVEAARRLAALERRIARLEREREAALPSGRRPTRP